jgi:putative ABC transport system ATP-binding protein
LLPFIQLRQVVKTFHNAAGDFTALKGIDAAFREGEFVSIVGRSGSGKSTLLNMMTGIDHPTSGEVRVGAAVLQRMNEGQMSVWRGRNMGIVFQFFQLLPMLTLLENVMLPMDFGGVIPAGVREPRALALLEQVGLAGWEHKYPAAVSGGQQQSAAVARALANDPPVLVADEPTGNLDSGAAERVLEIFQEQVGRGKTVLMVTHDGELARRAQRVLVISDGELVNESVSRALPDLPHEDLLQLSRLARACSLANGQGIEAPPAGGLLIVTGGALERRGEQLGPGSLVGGEDPAALRAVANSEVLWLEGLADSPALRRALDGATGQRAAGSWPKEPRP